MGTEDGLVRLRAFPLHGAPPSAGSRHLPSGLISHGYLMEGTYPYRKFGVLAMLASSL
jgi:hypothetical protein